jgi:hypothetical protein
MGGDYGSIPLKKPSHVIWIRSAFCSGKEFFQQCFSCSDKEHIFMIQGYQDIIREF